MQLTYRLQSFCWNRLDMPVLMAGTKPLMIEFGMYYGMESCVPRIQNAGRYTCIMIARSTEVFPTSSQLPSQPLQMSGLGGGVTIKPPPIWIDNVSCYTPAILTVSV